MNVEQWKEMTVQTLRERFNKEFIAYIRWARAIDWKSYGEKMAVDGIPDNPADIDPFLHLMQVDIMPLLAKMPDNLINIRRLMTHSKGSVCSVPAASFADRINSAGGNISYHGNYCLKQSEISEVVPLKVNRTFLSLLVQQYGSDNEHCVF